MSNLQLTRSKPRSVVSTEYLGPWCISGSDTRPLFSEISHEDLPALYKERDDLYSLIVITLCKYFNEVHGLDKPQQYWEALIYRFLGNYLNEVIARFYFLKAALEDDSDRVPIVVSREQYLKFVTDADIQKRYESSDQLNLQLFSDIAVVMCEAMDRPYVEDSFDFYVAEQTPSKQQSKWKVVKHFVSLLPSNYTEFISLRRAFYSRVAGRFHSDQIVVFAAHFAKRTLNRIEQMSSFRLRSFQVSEKRNTHAWQETTRKLLLPREGAPLLERCVIRSLASHLPQDYIEYFNDHQTSVADAIASYGTPKVMVGGYISAVTDRLWAATCRQQGSKFILVQHGSAYGESRKMPWQNAELSIADTFVSWGWEGRKVKALPAPRLTDLVISNRNPQHLLLVLRMNYTFPKLDYSLQICNDKEQRTFLSTLEEEVREETIARIRINKYASEKGQALWQKDFPSVAIDRGEASIYEQLSIAKVVAVDYLFSTTFAECIAQNIPVIAFAKDQETVIHEDAAECYRELYKVGVIFYDAKEAAEAVNEIFKDPDAWRQEPARIAAIERYQYLYARVSSTAAEDWSNFLDEQLG